MNWIKRIRSGFHELRDLRKADQQARLRQESASPIVTLTTTPRRIANIKPTLLSLLKQELPPREVQITIGLDLFAGAAMPAFLGSLNTVKLYAIQNDLGPATKYIPALERWAHSDQLLVVADDDMFYHPNWLRSLVTAEQNGPRDTSYCVNGFLLPRSLKSEDRPSDRPIASGTARVAVVEGCGGYTLRPGFADPGQLRDLSRSPQRALFDDDVWISGHLSRNHILKLQIPAGRRRGLINTVESAIGGNRARLQTELFNYFRPDWQKEEFQ